MKSLKEINIKRTSGYVLVAIAAIALYFGLVHLVLMAANVSKSAPSTVYGLTSKRQFALVALGLALISVILGWRAFRKSASRTNVHKRKNGPIVAIVSGLMAVISGVLNLAAATGGPGSGNGVLGSAQALILGLIGIILGALAMIRFRRTNHRNN
ncbi:MAG TPA: DUF6223 family protein [Chitinophagaceae bacterium]|jgi:hypothetical protein